MSKDQPPTARFVIRVSNIGPGRKTYISPGDHLLKIDLNYLRSRNYLVELFGSKDFGEKLSETNLHKTQSGALNLFFR